MNTLLLKDVLLDGRMRDILIENTQISRIGNGIEAPGAKIINGAGHLAAVVPFYNTHTHTAMTLLRAKWLFLI